MNTYKKLSIRIFILLYTLSYFLQNIFFVDRKKVYAAENPSTSNIVAVFVDKNIYQNIKTDLVRYTTKYIQKKIANSKVVVLPIDTATLKAHEISQMLENMYFEGIKDESSKLVGTILIGDVPLPVVENNGFIYPSIFPYVDFEKQEFIYDSNKKFFVYNNNPNGQAELRHGIINFDTLPEYSKFFAKVKSYYENPTAFIDKAIRYDDFIGTKKYFIPENTKYYINSLIFSEDIGYHRFNNLLLNTLKDEHNDSTLAVGNDLNNDLQATDDPELKAYASDMASRNSTTEGLTQQIDSSMPTLTLKKATQEMLKGYDGLISSQFLSKIKDNVAGLARRYKSTEGETFTDYSSVIDKIAQKDNRALGDSDNDVQPLLIQINNFLEDKVNSKVDTEKYYMTIPIPLSKLEFKGEKKGTAQKKCTRKTYNYYENYYFGQSASLITNAEELSIYRGTYQNLTSIAGQNLNATKPLESIGGSYNIFSTQVEANRGYNFNSTQEELERYKLSKTNKQDLRQLKCTNYFLNWKRLGICMQPRARSVNDSDDGNKCYIGNQDKEGGCETLNGFAARNRGGASPMNMDASSQKLVNYNYKNAVLPIYDIAGSKKIASAEAEGNSYKGAMKYASVIQKKFGVGDLQYGSNNISSLISNPKSNGSNLIFTNQLPVGNLESPTRISTPPKTYAETNFFTLFTALPNHVIFGGKAVVFNINPGSCGGDGNIYTYKTIDSRVKNTSPTRDQVSDTEFYKFKNSSDLEDFYNRVITDLAQTKNDIIRQSDEFSGETAMDITGVITNLEQIKTKVIAYNSGNNSGINKITTFDILLLSGYTPAQINQLAHTRTGTSIDDTGINELTGMIEKVDEGLENLLNYMDSLNINNVGESFNKIIQTEKFKKQKVEILDSRKNNINQNLDYITTNVNTLKSTFTTAKNIYPAIQHLNDNRMLLQNQKTGINALRSGNGCKTIHYKSLCDALDDILVFASGQTDLAKINSGIIEIHQYQGDNDENGNPTTVKPFIEIDQKFTPAKIAAEIAQIKATMNTFDVSTNPNKKEKNKGMNLTTQDRPIDNIRNITFQGIAGDLVQLNYPNIYEVKTYKTENNKLVLKTPIEIREAIKEYLTNKATEYNNLLNQQIQKRNAYYNSSSAQFNFLGGLDPLANPNTHNYNVNPIPSNYFINQLVAFLDTLENAPEYGKTAIYGNAKASTNDEKIDMIAKLLYYQNITWPERLQQSTVSEDITEVKNSFDVNQKISHITNTYLTENNDQGKFITPVYNTTGYEIAYINSDGQDYVSAKPVPSFIQQIQAAQEKVAGQNSSSPKNTFSESSQSESDGLQNQVDACEGVDSKGTALLFDFKTFSSPRGKAMACRAKQIFKISVKMSFKNSLGPVIVGSNKKDIIAEITGATNNIGKQRSEYGAQRNAQNNEDTIDQASDNIKQTLEGYNNNAVITIDKTIIGVDNTGSNIKIKVGMTQNVGNINVKISGIGDNCFSIKRNGNTLSENICTKKAQEFFNPNTEDYTFELVVKQKIAGSTALKIELCPSAGNVCITKQQVITIVSAPIAHITLDTIRPVSPIIVMEGGEIPLLVSATDTYGNKIGQSIQPYSIGVNTGDGEISDGNTSSNRINFDNFAKAGFIYKAPVLSSFVKKGVPFRVEDLKNKSITITVEGSGGLAQKSIIVAKGIIKVSRNNELLYQTENNIIKPILFTLPKDASDIQYYDGDAIAQIKPEAIPSLTISVQDKNGNKLDTVANITSEQGLLSPGTVEERNITKSNGTKKQIIFSPNSNFIISNGKLDIALYPNFKAGADTITINIPGIEPIIIPVTVNPGGAKTVLLTLEKSRMDLTSSPESKGTIQVLDTRNNRVTQPTIVKLGVIGAATTNITEFTYTGKEYTYTITGKKPGGEGYIFAYLKDRALTEQMPGYERFIIQESVLPKEKLNVMYLNLFGTDRGNQRGYFSTNNKTINAIMSGSNKLITSTTELVDPSKIKQIEYIISQQGQIQSINNKAITLTIENKGLVALLPEIGKVHLGTTQSFDIQTFKDTGEIAQFKKDTLTNTLLYIPEATDSVITGNEATKTAIRINGNEVMNLTNGTLDPNMSIIADNETIGDMRSYKVTFNEKTIGKFMLRSKTNITTNSANIDLEDPITYGKTTVFSEGSTNTQGIGIYLRSSAFTKQGYQSIEDSSDGMLGIGFTSDFKNIANFANGKSVGEATLPYGSQFLINFGDPLLERREANPNIPNTDFDASIGQDIYADPNKTIFKVLPIDFNRDGVKDLIVVYTDGVIKLLKNYGGTTPYKNLQELMIVAEPIKDIKIGDGDGNGFEDIFIMTSNDKGIVYLNDKGVFPVDGKNICLNVNAEPGDKNPNPEDFSKIKQIFVEDMNKDGKLDIVTNDSFNDIKVFYGGMSKEGINYISSTTGTCDTDRYARQKDNYKTIKRFGIKINSSRYIQDESLVHRKGTETPVEGVKEEKEVTGPDTTAGMSESQMQALKVQTMNDIQNMVANNNVLVAAGKKQLAYTANPLSHPPVYETLPNEEISYLPISESNDAVSIYKQYGDSNGGVLRQNDEVVIKTTIISKKNNNKLTYIDQLKGPRTIAKNSDNKISSFVFTTNNTGGLIMDRNGPEGYQFVIDNIKLNSGESLSFSYKVKYQEQTPPTTIAVKDEDLLKENRKKDTYPDIITSSSNACQKNRRIFFNTQGGDKKSYDQVYDDIQKEIDDYNSGAQNSLVKSISTMTDQIANVSSLETLSSLPGLNNLEQRSAKDIINSIVAPGGGSVNINTSFIDNATKKVSKKLDAALQGLCQGFSLGKGGCNGVPVPFNQAFLAPGDYHIFGCVPQLPNPLYPAFKVLNSTLGKGIPILTVPATLQTPVGPVPFIGGLLLPFTQKGATDGFFIGGLPGGIYPSQFRLYIAPTLTLGLGIAMCFGPYTVGGAIPKPFRDLGGNCVVFAIPPLTSCGNTSNSPGTENQPSVESLGSSMVTAAGQGVCTTPPKIGNTIVFAADGNTINNVNTANAPFQIVAAGSSENNPPYSAAIPQGNFGGLISMDQDPTRVSASEDYGNAQEQLQQGTSYEGYELKKGEKITLKIIGGKAKGLVKCMVQDRTTRQIQYIQNNLTKMTIQLDLPDISTIFQGFDKIGNLEETYKSINQQSNAEGYKDNRTEGLSKQQVNNITQKAGRNPFEAIQQMFSEVPLVNIDSKDINVKIPTLTSDDIKKYQNYLELWITKNGKILEDWTDMLNQMLAMCGTTSKEEAKTMKAKLQTEKGLLDSNSNLSTTDKSKLSTWIDSEIKDMDAIIALPENTTRQQLGSDVKNIGTNLTHTATKISKLPYWKMLQVGLLVQKTKEGASFPKEDQARLDTITKIVGDLEKCSGVAGSMNKFVSFRENSAGLIRSIKENINVLEKYKEFPTQLYERTHLTDRYLTEISSLISDFVGTINSWLNTNANRFSQYVDAITLIVGAIKTWQAIIDFSVNRSEKCSKCSNDNYGSFSCSLSFLCPKLPIFPIPAFKIPNIYMDMSHIDLGLNIILPKINFIPIKIPLPQLPNLPEAPNLEIDRNVLYGLDIDFFKDVSFPTVPVIPEPPTLPEPPSFIPSIKIDLPVLPPAPKIPKILPEINGILKVATFIGKVFCIIKGGIGLVGEKGVKGKIEQITQRTWNVPFFDTFDLTTKFKDPPLQGFDYKLDAYATLKFNFDGVYDVFSNIAKTTNSFVSENLEAPAQEAVDLTTKTLNNNAIITGILTPIESLDQKININGYHSNPETGMLDYTVAYNQLKQGLIKFKNDAITDKTMNDRVQIILATIENKSTILPATHQIEQVEKAAKEIVKDKIKENEAVQKEIQKYDTFIKKLRDNEIALVANTTLSTSLKTPILTIDAPTQHLLQSQEDPTKTYLTLNQKMVQGYLDAVDKDGPEKLNMTTSTYTKSKKYLETTKEKIDTALLAYNDQPLIAQAPPCTNCANSTAENNYSPDISAYVNGVFVESYTGKQKDMVNTLVSSEQIQNVQKTYTTNVDFNNDKLPDILMYDANSIYIKYAKQQSTYLSAGGNPLTTYYTTFYSYENTHPRSIFNTSARYIESMDQLKSNSDSDGYITINDITIKVTDGNKEVKNFRTQGQTFDNLQLGWKNSKSLGEPTDGYIIKMSNKIDDKDTPKSFRNFLSIQDAAKYILVLPKNTEYKKGLLTVEDVMTKKPINLALGESILAIEYYDPGQEDINLTFKDLPRKRLYTSIATLNIHQEELSSSQKKSFVMYKKSSPRSNQTVAGMQTLGDITAPVGEINLWRDTTKETVSEGLIHEGYINTLYTLKSTRTDNVIVAKMIIQKEGKTIFEKDNQSQTGTIDVGGLFFTGATQQSFDFIAIDQNNNITKETVNININIPDIEVTDVKKSGEKTADIMAKISNDIDEGMIVFQRLRNGVRKDIEGSNQSSNGGFQLSPKQTIITGGIFTMGDDIGLYDKQGNELATINPKTGEIKINKGFEDKVKINLSLTTHIPVVELRDNKNNTLFQIVLPIEAINEIQMNQGIPNYEEIKLTEGDFGAFNNGYCIKNTKDDCVLYTNNAGAIYIPGTYANSLQGEYVFDKASQKTKLIIKDEANKNITTLTVQIKADK